MNNSTIKKIISKKLKFKTVLVLILLFFADVVTSQTLISPTGDGGFETGNTFAANNWTVANGGNPKRNWYVGTGQLGYSGNRCAFIGNNATTVGTDGSARVQHLYRSITVPAGATNIQLSFKYKQAVSDFSLGTYYDYIAVYTDVTAPVGGIVPAGTLVFGPYPNANVTSFTTQNITLSNALAGTTTNLIFTFDCNNISPDGYGAVDDISLTFTPAPMPTITNLLIPSSGCAGSNITINGTNFTGATAANIKIGGTPIASITSNNGTTIDAVIGAGTTGKVSVTTAGGTATSIGTFTVNSLPVNPGNPLSNSPQCNPPGVTLTRAAPPPGTENYYWQTTSLGTSTISSGNTYTATTTNTYYIRSKTTLTGCWSLGQGSLAVVVDTNFNTLATIPSPGNAVSGICYAGNGVTTSVSWTAASGASSYDVYFGPGSLPGSVTSTTAVTSFSTGTLLASTTYYWKIVPRNACGATTGIPITWTFTTSGTPCYCTPTGNLDCTLNDYISNVTLNNLNNTTTCSGGGYTLYPSSGTQTTNLVTGQTYTFNFSVGAGSGTHAAGVWIDFNQNGVFTDAGEYFLISNAISPNTTTSVLITIPAGASIGTVRMRVRYAYNVTATSTMSCIMAGTYGETEDYTLTLAAPILCVTPIAQPGTPLSLTSLTSTSLNGTFPIASPSPSGYLVVRSSSATPPTLINGTTYAPGFTGLLPGTTKVIQGSDFTNNTNSFADSALMSNTKYYYYIFSYNNTCTGAPYYLTSSPLTNNTTTCPANPTIPVNSAITTSSFTATWTASVVGGNASIINYILEVYTNAGYTTPVPGSPFSVGTAVTFNVTGLNGSTTYYYKIKANNGSCDSTYVAGSVATQLSNDECIGAISLTVSNTCSYTTYSNAGASGSVGMVAPGCANYLGGDVWFSAVVPATGELDIDLIEGVMTDSGMAFYTGTCGSLTLLDCDDDSSSNGLMSYISKTGLTPGQTIYIRVWEYGNNNNGTFGICANTPSCPSPSNLYSNILSNSSVTVNWNASTPPASGGYQYYINITGVAPSSSTIPTGATSAGVISVTLTGLTIGQKYYFWVRSYCGGPDVSTWYGPTNYSPCAVGNGTGNTTNACPSIIAGGQGLNGANPAAVMCSASTCTNLEATYLQLNQSTNYSVSSIPFTPPYQFTCLQNPVSVNVDDVWSSNINLPFNFCFYGNNYNKCLIGSNGVVTFDTTSNTAGGYSAWTISNDLPNVSLFKNTIFGVYHDIDPSKGGQVGWELITLNTGCRALVASWNNIPMYSASCNSSLYTGMIVLYENTNVIEVYIKEKNVCSTWNSGNAIVGIQNSAGNAAIVAPNRNGLSTDWITTNEAWRFTPTGPSLTSVKWFQGNGTSGTQIGTTDIINVCPTVTTTYTAEVTYALCNGTNLKYTGNALVTVNGNKIWNGTQSTDWNVSNNWTPSGVPTNANCVIIPTAANNPVISNSPDAVGYNLLVYNNAQLTLNSNKNLTIIDKVTVQPSGIFTINNSASLIQINNILNSGNIFYKRDASNIRTLDYVYWSSPVSNFNVDNIVSPYSFGPIYKWNTIVSNSNGGQGTWQTATGSTMIAGKGYIARSPGTAPFNNATFNTLNGTFTGVPNNGDITLPIERGTDQNTALHYGTNGTQVTNLSDNWNLLGNPYPSAIRGSQFLFDNNTKIEGNIRLWTHGTLPSNLIQSPFYASFAYNYTAGDYLTYNFTGTSCCPAAASDIFIGAGQGFFVQMTDGPTVSAADNVTVSFNNNLRNASFNNTVFYRTINSTTSSNSFDVNTIERNRIWLDLVNPNGQSDRTLFGYIENATMGQDSYFDCITQNYGGTQLYSEVGDTKFSIQGRSLPFNVNDEVPIGINVPVQGNYTIAIAGIDGLFNNQNIYLRDNLLNITHDLKANPYSFSSNIGAINDRFKVIYITNALGTSNTVFENNVNVITNKEVLVTSRNLLMQSIIVYNILGQKLATYNNINSNDLILASLNKNNATLLLKIKLQTGETVIKKIIY